MCSQLTDRARDTRSGLPPSVDAARDLRTGPLAAPAVRADPGASFDMVFVSNTGRADRPFYDPSARYRTFALAEHFRRAGHRVAFLAQSRFEREPDAFAGARLVQFHRPSATEAMLRYVGRNRRRQVLVADYDDLVFDVAATPETPAVRDRGEDETRIARSLAANAEIGAMFGHCSVSTAPLAERAEQVLGQRPVIVHNALDPLYTGIARTLAREAARPEFDLGYFSGTASHNRDLALIAPQIAAYLDENPARRMLVFGPVSIPEPLRRHSDRIETRKVVSFYQMPVEIRRCRMVLGPLEDTTFARCKSGLKFFEAGALGVSVAATPIPDIDRFTSPLLHKCRRPKDWAAAFRAPDPDPAARTEAVERVLDTCRLDRQVAVWSNAFLES